MKLNRQLGIDLGTTRTLVLEAGEGIVVNEPTVVAVGVEDDRVLAVGSMAKEMLGKTPEYIEIVKPLEDGAISNYAVTLAMLRYFMKLAMGKFWLLGPEVMVAVPSGLTQVEQRAVMDAILTVGARKVYLIDKPLAAAIGAKISVSEAGGNMIVDIGGGVTEAAVISLGGVVTSKSIRVGGSRIDRAIEDYLKKKMNMAIGDLTAEAIKVKIGSAIRLKRAETMEVGGRDLLSGLPKTVEIGSDEVHEAIQPIVGQIVEIIKGTLEITPPELVSDIADRGIVLSGGGAQLRGLNVLVTREIGVSAHMALEPDLCVVKGTGMAIENLDVYRRAIL